MSGRTCCTLWCDDVRVRLSMQHRKESQNETRSKISFLFGPQRKQRRHCVVRMMVSASCHARAFCATKSSFVSTGRAISDQQELTRPVPTGSSSVCTFSASFRASRRRINRSSGQSGVVAITSRAIRPPFGQDRTTVDRDQRSRCASTHGMGRFLGAHKWKGGT